MLRSILARRPRAQLLSLHGHGQCRSVAHQLGYLDRTMSEPYTSDEDATIDTDGEDISKAESAVAAGRSTFTTSPAGYRRQHLYLALDDWKHGFSIHKLDLEVDAGAGTGGGGLTLGAPVHRVTSPGYPPWNVAGMGSKTVATREPGRAEGDHVPVTLVYDTETTGLSVAPPLPSALHRSDVIKSVAAGNGLYVFDGSEPGKGGSGMFRLEKAPTRSDCEQWSWRSIPSPLPFGWQDTIMSTAVLHRDHQEQGSNRHAIFVSVRCYLNTYHHGSGFCPPGHGTVGDHTYSYDPEEGEWRHHGQWALPFRGHAHYDGELDAWVGLHRSDDWRNINNGFLCSCDVITSPPATPAPAPDWKRGAEQLFNPPWNKNVDLVYMGDSNYCLVEFEPLEPFRRRRCAGAGNKSAVRLATFRLKYGKKGELLATARRPDRSLLYSRYNESFVPHAFLDVVEARKDML